MATIEIDGQPVDIDSGQMVIEAADKAGIHIPRFCYHKKLKIAANCRMCLVDVENAPKPVPACATPVSDGMVVRTQSQRARDAQKSVMEFLLINHPLDCPICDQGGQCELQDVAMGYGKDVSRFSEGKRVVDDKDLGSLIATDMTRCIHCTRCVRYGDEVAGKRELGATGRGEHTEIGTFLEQNVTSNVSGNVIDLCPVGALTSKPFRYTARAWELEQRPSIGAHDALNASLLCHTLQGQLKRVVPQEADTINECWLSDRDRYSYEGYGHSDRLLSPEIKVDGRWQVVDWQTALQTVVERTKTVFESAQPDQWGMLISPNATMEEGYLFQKLARDLQCGNVDHRVHQSDFEVARGLAGLPIPLSELSEQDCIVLMGCDLENEQPLLATRLRRSHHPDRQIIVLNHSKGEISGVEVQKHLAKSGDLLSLLQAQCATGGELLKALSSAEKALIIVGEQAQYSPQYTGILEVASKIANESGAQFARLKRGANAAGLQWAGCHPLFGSQGQKSAISGLNAGQMLENPRDVLWVYGLESADFSDPSKASRAFSMASHVVRFTAFVTPEMRDQSDVLLPVALPYENTGSYLNLCGEVQSTEAAAALPGETKPTWKILRVLGNLFGLDDYQYQRRQDVTQALNVAALHFEKALSTPESVVASSHALPSAPLRWIPNVGQYACDMVLRRARALQNSAIAQQERQLYIHSTTAANLHLKEGANVQVQFPNQETPVQATLAFDDGLPVDVVTYHLGNWSTSAGPFQPITLRGV